MKVLPQHFAIGLALFIATSVAIASSDHPRAPTSDLNGLNFTYPFPIHIYKFRSQAEDLEMAYMDVHPAANPNGLSIILMHGKNFCGATWNATAIVLLAAGYRVIIPDQIGFCKSSKPVRYQFSLHQLAMNTLGLLEELGVRELTVMGHSLGGMLATRFALMYPSNTTRLVLVDPIGLEDWKALGVPYQSIDVSYVGELASNYSSIRAYEQATYYVGNWSSAYDVWVNMLVEVYKGRKGVQFAWDMALATDMVYTQPVVYEFPLLKMPTLLVVGDKDNTAIGKAWSPPSVQKLLGHYNVLGKKVAKMIPNATLIEFPELGHAPHIEDPAGFQKALMSWLSK